MSGTAHEKKMVSSNRDTRGNFTKAAVSSFRSSSVSGSSSPSMVADDDVDCDLLLPPELLLTSGRGDNYRRETATRGEKGIRKEKHQEAVIMESSADSVLFIVLPCPTRVGNFVILPFLAAASFICGVRLGCAVARRLVRV